MTRWGPRVLSFSMVGLLAACGGRSADQPGAPDAPAGGDASSRGPIVWAEMLCAYERACCRQAGFSVTGLARCEGGYWLPSFSDGRVVADQRKLDECLAAAARQPVACTAAGSATVSLCGAAFVGTVLEGGSCRNGGDCVLDTDLVVCDRTDDASTSPMGVCRRSLRVGPGEPCFFTKVSSRYQTHPGPGAPTRYAHCDWHEGLYCKRETQTCTPLAAAGRPCDDHFGCAAGLYCDGTCRSKKADGSACVSYLECTSGLCHHTTGTCRSSRVDQSRCTGS